MPKKRKHKISRCPVCSEISCGDDFHTKNRYTTERNAGDRTKIILLQIFDLSEIDGLQNSEIKALISNLIDEHLFEVDLQDEDE